MNNPKKNTRNNSLTIRFTDEELAFLEWYSDRVDCDRANAPRMIISAYTTDHPELLALFKEASEKQDKPA